MKKFQRKGAIELSANFIIVIIISSIIVVGGLALFFRMQHAAQSVADKLDPQTEARIKSMMLSDNDHVTVYPSDPVMGPGDSKLIGIGVTNNYDDPTKTKFTVDVISVYRYTKEKADGENAIDAVNTLNKFRDITSSGLTIPPHGQGVKGILLRMPSTIKGQYVYTIEIKNSDNQQYGIVQVYANNP